MSLDFHDRKAAAFPNTRRMLSGQKGQKKQRPCAETSRFKEERGDPCKQPELLPPTRV